MAITVPDNRGLRSLWDSSLRNGNRSLFKIFLIVAVFFPAPRSLTANDGARSRGAGLKAEVIGAKIGSDLRPVVMFRISDSKGQPLDLDRIDPGSIKFTIASLETPKDGQSQDYNYTRKCLRGARCSRIVQVKGIVVFVGTLSDGRKETAQRSGGAK